MGFILLNSVSFQFLSLSFLLRCHALY